MFKLELNENIASLIMDDGKANAMTVQWFDDLAATFDKAAADGAKVVVLKGRQKFFSAGLDLEAIANGGPNAITDISNAFRRTMIKIYTFPVPTVAMVTGHAVAGGFILASACDVRVGLDGRFKYMLNETQIGIPVPDWFVPICESALPRPIFERMGLGALPMSPSEMAQAGFLAKLAEDGAALEEAAAGLAQHLSTLSPTAFADSKKTLRAGRIAALES